jgi:hypothetical protein
MSQTVFPDERIAAIRPTYTEAGSMNLILNTNGTQNQSPLQIHTLLRRLANNHAADLKAIKKRISALTQCLLLPPLPITAGMFLVPLKLRIPRVEGDSTIGYVNLYAVRNVTKCCQPPFQSELQLEGGWKLPVVWGDATVRKHLCQANLLSAAILYQSPVQPEIRIMANKLAEVFDELLRRKK